MRFYPRHPRGWRQIALVKALAAENVSIHATLAGGDFVKTTPGTAWNVSIHATLAGGDPHRQGYPKPGREVSIHATLAGGDLCRAAGRGRAKRFLSTPPSRVATLRQQLETVAQQVSIHATLAGGDRFLSAMVGKAQRFYPRHPRGWRPLTYATDKRPEDVSIHATLAGGDGRNIPDLRGRTGFLSTPPSRVATKRPTIYFCGGECFYPRHPRGWRRRYQPSIRRRTEVSIHATLAGGDQCHFLTYHRDLLFLSTPPSRVATIELLILLLHLLSFYPRHPRGWRRL